MHGSNQSKPKLLATVDSLGYVIGMLQSIPLLSQTLSLSPTSPKSMDLQMLKPVPFRSVPLVLIIELNWQPMANSWPLPNLLCLRAC